ATEKPTSRHSSAISSGARWIGATWPPQTWLWPRSKHPAIAGRWAPVQDARCAYRALRRRPLWRPHPPRFQAHSARFFPLPAMAYHLLEPAWVLLLFPWTTCDRDRE